jgi:hypothetical protein
MNCRRKAIITLLVLANATYFAPGHCEPQAGSCGNAWTGVTGG